MLFLYKRSTFCSKKLDSFRKKYAALLPILFSHKIYVKTVLHYAAFEAKLKCINCILYPENLNI